MLEKKLSIWRQVLHGQWQCILHLCSPVALPRPHPEDNRAGVRGLAFWGIHLSPPCWARREGWQVSSLCGQLEWIIDQRLPSRCHIQCYPFPINQRPGPEPLVQGILKFFFIFLLWLLLILDQILTVKLSLLFRKLFAHVTNSPRQLVYLSLL